jgi:TonB family protein
VSICKIAALLIVTTAIGVTQGIPSQESKSRSVEPRRVPESVTSRLLCGSVAPPRSDSNDTRKVGVETDERGNTFCGPTPRPLYPESAKRAGIQGKVILEGVIGKDGIIRHLRVVEGHPALISGALDAVKKWKYKPYLENGEPVEVKTTVTVNFTLEGSAQRK